MARLNTLVAICLVTLSTAAVLRGKTESQFTINDQVYVDGVLFQESSDLEVTCNPVGGDGTAHFKVCGCGVQVIAHLRLECGEYQQYDEKIGSCNCGSSACDDRTLTAGYTEKFEWK